MILKTIGFLSAFCLIACGLPELYYGIKTGNVGAGWGLLILWFAGEVFGLIYVIPLKKYPLIFNYAFNTAIVGAILCVKYGFI